MNCHQIKVMIKSTWLYDSSTREHLTNDKKSINKL